MSANPATGGTVPPSGTTTHNEGASVTVAATSAAGFTFTGWSGHCSGVGGCTLTMDENKIATAGFTAAPAPSPGGGSGTFTDSGQSLGSSSSQGVAVRDVDGDGDLDAFVASDGVSKVWLNG